MQAQHPHTMSCQLNMALGGVLHASRSARVDPVRHHGLQGAHLQVAQIGHGTPALVGHVVDDQHAARVRHLVVVPVVRLPGTPSGQA